MLNRKNHYKLRGLVARLNMVVCGCGSATCPFQRDDETDLIGTANLCRCGQVAYDIVQAIDGIITSTHIAEGASEKERRAV